MQKAKARFRYSDYKQVAEAVDILEQKQLSAATIEEFGLCYIEPDSNTNTDLLWCRMSLPIHGVYGNKIAMAGRRLDSKALDIENAYNSKYTNTEYAATKLAKWLKSKWINDPYNKQTQLFNIHRAYRSILELDYCIVVEGYFDVMAMFDKGIYNVVAICGVKMSKYQAMFLKAFTDNIVIMLDPDEGGESGTESMTELLNEVSMDSIVAVLPDGNDPDDFIRRKKASSLNRLFKESFEDRVGRLYLS